jgi:hypothetical protein
MTVHLHRFVDRVRGAEARGSKDFHMSLQEAKDLHADITKLLLNLQTLQELSNNQNSNSETITVEINGGTFQ